MAEKNPTEDATERMTKAMPNNPNVNLEPTNTLRGNRGNMCGVLRGSADREGEDEGEGEPVRQPAEGDQDNQARPDHT